MIKRKTWSGFFFTWNKSSRTHENTFMSRQSDHVDMICISRYWQIHDTYNVYMFMNIMFSRTIPIIRITWYHVSCDMIISWIQDGYYENMVDEYQIIYKYLAPYWCCITWLILWTHDTHHVSCVVTKALLSLVCVCVQHKFMLMSLQLFKDTCHMIMLLGKVIQMWEIMRQWARSGFVTRAWPW